MTVPQPSEVSRLLLEWKGGDAGAAERLFPILYDELKRLASHQLRGESTGHTLQTTALVHEAYLRLVGADVAWEGRRHFFAVAAQVMRRVLVDHARARGRAKVFGACRCVSTHFPLSEAVVAQGFPGLVTSSTPDTTPYIIRDIAAGQQVPGGTQYWFDYETKGLDSAYTPTHEAVREWLLRAGRVEGRDFVVRRYDGANHNEASWRARLEDPLTFLFGSRPE